MRLANKVTVITGAGSGMGAAMARMFSAQGAKVVLADISGKQHAVAAAIGDAAVAIHADVTREADVQALIAIAEEKFGRLDILCNNAGLGGGTAPLHEQSSEHWDFIHDLNLKSAFLGMKYGIISMMKTGGGAIVNTTSSSGLVGWKHHTVYSSAKAGLNHLTKSAALDYAGHNIRINAVAPGTMWTGMVPRSATIETPGPDDQRVPGIPMDRWGAAEDIAAAALFLASDEASYITGVVLPVDGGFSIGFSALGAEITGVGSRGFLADPAAVTP